jgi:hypothetical protein
MAISNSLKQRLGIALTNLEAADELISYLASGDSTLHSKTFTPPYTKNPITGIPWLATTDEEKSTVATLGWASDWLLKLVTQYTWKDAVRAVAVSNIPLGPLPGSLTVDGVTLNPFEMVLLAGQTNAAENGPYIVVAPAPGFYLLVRSYTAPDGESFRYGNAVPVRQGIQYAGTLWFGCSPTKVFPGDGDIVLGVDPIVYKKLSPDIHIQETIGTGDGSETDFLMSSKPSSASSINVYVNRQLKYPSEYTVNLITQQISLSAPPALGEVVYVTYSY